MSRIEKIKGRIAYESMHTQDVAFLDLLEWLLALRKMGDRSWENFSCTIANCFLVLNENGLTLESIPTKTTDKNVATRYAQLWQIIEIPKFRNEIWNWQDVKVFMGKYTLRDNPVLNARRIDSGEKHDYK